MGLFGNDAEQDARLDSIESYLRALSEVVHQNQLDSIALRMQLVRLEAQLSDKVSSEDIDPSFVTLNEQVAAAREEIERAADAAADSWSTLQAGAAEALATLRSSAEEAAVRIEQEIRGDKK